MKELSQEELRELERQLSHPSGAFGTEVGKQMNETNIGMTTNTIRFMNLEDHHHVLELGHGNCGHLNALLSKAAHLQYNGLEISETMHEIAQNSHTGESARFQLYDGENIPFEAATFDRIFTVNTVYFWAKPKQLLQEIERVLKRQGTCIISFVNKEVMENLPFVGDVFALYDIEKIEALTAGTGLKVQATETLTEQVKSNAGGTVERTFTMAKLCKA